MSHPRCMVFDNRKHQRPIPDVDRAAWEHFVERPRPGAGADALDSKVAAVGVGPTGGARAPAIFAFFLRTSGKEPLIRAILWGG